MTASGSEAQTWVDANVTGNWVDTTKLNVEQKEEFVAAANRYAKKLGFEIRDTQYGKGLFAAKTHKSGTEIEYLGMRVPKQLVGALPNSYDKVVGENLVGDIMKRSKPNVAAFANDPGKNGKPNAQLQELDDKVYLVLLRKVKAGDEITVSYGDAYWEGNEQYHSSK